MTEKVTIRGCEIEKDKCSICGDEEVTVMDVFRFIQICVKCSEKITKVLVDVRDRKTYIYERIIGDAESTFKIMHTPTDSEVMRLYITDAGANELCNFLNVQDNLIKNLSAKKSI